MPQRKHQKTGNIGEDTRIAVNLSMKKFIETPEMKEMEFPSSYTHDERAYIHSKVLALGLKSKSRGKGANRFITIYKQNYSTIIQSDATLNIQKSSKQGIHNLIQKFPLNNKERQDLLPPMERERIMDNETISTNIKVMGRLNNSIPQIPQLRTNMDLIQFRASLPVYSARDKILEALSSNQVIMIVGETGSGKTTQVPQYILENCQQKKQACRIICTQPRRLAAVSMAERVAFERDEKIGLTFGYQIRLESRVAPKTLLTYCTNGVLLRTLMGNDSALATITHIIVDEVHERDRFSDFLLIALKDALTKYRTLKLVLMSATVDTNIFVKYFNQCSVINVAGRLFDVDIYYLEDILKLTNYMTKEMAQKEKKLVNKKEQRKVLESWTQYPSNQPGNNSSITMNAVPSPILGQQTEPVPEKIDLEPKLREEMDKSIADAWLHGTEDNFAQMLYLILLENISVDYQHSHTLVTPLMVAAGRGSLNTTEQLLNLGANLNIRASNEWTALDWARTMNQIECAELIEAYMKTYDCSFDDPESASALRNAALSEKDKTLLDVYYNTFNDDNIDFKLLLKLLIHIHTKMPPGAILVFLPGYDDIAVMRERINAESEQMNQGMRFNLFILHSNMQTSDQKRAFRRSSQGVRKIILSTNIAETSITIDDIVYVIDSGKVKETAFDALSSVCSFKSNWISQACAEQRKGRAGRCQHGICYRLYSSTRFESLQKHQTPEILRSPLHELCLFTKHLAPGKTPIVEYLDRALEPPANIITRNAVYLLKSIDALDAWEDLTELGTHLLDLPVEPRLGKMLLYAVVLKCLDPILTIVCSLANKDSFIIPMEPCQKRGLKVLKKKFSADTFSDHMALLRAFQSWQHARANGWERQFCDKNFISAAVMEMIVGMRTQLLGQLRASGFVRARSPGDIRDLNLNSENWAVVKAALTAGLYPNLIRVDRECGQLRTQKESKVFFHPSSTLKEFSKSTRTTSAQSHAATLNALPSDWLIYEEMIRSGRFCHARTVSLINSVTVALFSGPARLPMDVIYQAESVPESESDSEVEESREGMTILKFDDWVSFKSDFETARLILYLRQKWNALFLRRMRAPGRAMTQSDELVVKTIVSIISNEEQACEMQQPSGIGQRPRPLIVDYYPANARRSDDSEERNS